MEILLFKMMLAVVSTVIVTTFSAVGVIVFYGFKVYHLMKSKEVKGKKGKPRRK